MEKKSACEVLMTRSPPGSDCIKPVRMIQDLGRTLCGERSAEPKMIRTGGEEDRTVGRWPSRTKSVRRAAGRYRKRSSARNRERSAPFYRFMSVTKMSARGWERSVWDIKQSTREAVWSACEDKGPHAKRTCAEESTGVLANKNGPCVGG